MSSIKVGVYEIITGNTGRTTGANRRTGELFKYRKSYRKSTKIKMQQGGVQEQINIR